MKEKKEIIAKRSLFWGVLGYMTLFFSVDLILYGTLSYFFPDENTAQGAGIVFLIVIGAAAFVPAVIFLFKQYKPPKIVVWYENGVFHFPDFECDSETIKNIDYTKSKKAATGTLYVYTKNGDHVYNYVFNPEEVYSDFALKILSCEGYLNGK